MGILFNPLSQLKPMPHLLEEQDTEDLMGDGGGRGAHWLIITGYQEARAANGLKRQVLFTDSPPQGPGLQVVALYHDHPVSKVQGSGKITA